MLALIVSAPFFAVVLLARKSDSHVARIRHLLGRQEIGILSAARLNEDIAGARAL